MSKNYSALSGAELISGIRKRHRRGVVVCIVLIVLCAGLMIGGLYGAIHEKSMFIGIAAVALGGLIAWHSLGEIGRHNKIAAEPENCALFRKYGSPETIAARIAEESAEPVLSEKGTLLCRSFIMKQNDFESYVPLDQALLVYRKEHRTNGIKDGVYLVVHDVFGEKFEYPFKLRKKFEADMQAVMADIANRSQQCAVGYSQQNLQYAKAQAKQIP